MCIIFRVSFPLELSPYLVEYLAVLYIEWYSMPVPASNRFPCLEKKVEEHKQIRFSWLPIFLIPRQKKNMENSLSSLFGIVFEFGKRWFKICSIWFWVCNILDLHCWIPRCILCVPWIYMCTTVRTTELPYVSVCHCNAFGLRRLLMISFQKKNTRFYDSLTVS